MQRFRAYHAPLSQVKVQSATWMVTSGSRRPTRRGTDHGVAASELVSPCDQLLGNIRRPLAQRHGAERSLGFSSDTHPELRAQAATHMAACQRERPRRDITGRADAQLGGGEYSYGGCPESQRLSPPVRVFRSVRARRTQRRDADDAGSVRVGVEGLQAREGLTDLLGKEWRRRPDLNRGWRFCRPLPYLLATAPRRKSARAQTGPAFSAEKLERETGFEPATSTLARSHSTTELFPLGEPLNYHELAI